MHLLLRLDPDAAKAWEAKEVIERWFKLYPPRGTAAKTSSAYPLFFLAMAQHQLGKQDEARATLQKAAELAKAELSDEKNLPVWNRKLTLELLQKEAEGLIGI